jgi:hypothetical protein
MRTPQGNSPVSLGVDVRAPPNASAHTLPARRATRPSSLLSVSSSTARS